MFKYLQRIRISVTHIKKGTIVCTYLFNLNICTDDFSTRHRTLTYNKGKVQLTLIRTHNVSKGAKIRNRYNQVLHLTQSTNGKVTHSQLDSTNES